MSYQWDQQYGAFLLPGEQQHEIVQARRHSYAPHKVGADAASQQFWQNLFQNTLHQLLEGYLNGTSLSMLDRLRLRTMLVPRGHIQQLLTKAWHLAIEKLGWIDASDRPAIDAPAPNQLVLLYQLFDKQLTQAADLGEKVVVEPMPATPNDEPGEVTAIRRQASETLNRLQTPLLVQGSVATNEQIGYSDLDLWMVVSRKALADPQRLTELASLVFRIQRKLYDFDPLQHHGVMLATEIDLASYPETYLPLDAVAKARFLCPETGAGIAACPRDTRLESGMAFFNLLALFRQKVEQGAEFREAYHVKSMLSHIMLLPAFYEGALGRPCFKGDSFAKVKDCVPVEHWSIMEEVSEVRRQWRYQPSLARRVMQSSVRNPFLFQQLVRRGLSGKMGSVIDVPLPERWQQRALKLAECLWENLCR